MLQTANIKHIRTHKNMYNESKKKKINHNIYITGIHLRTLYKIQNSHFIKMVQDFLKYSNQKKCFKTKTTEICFFFYFHYTCFYVFLISQTN